MTLGPIPWDKVVLWCDRQGFDDVMTGLFEDVIARLDNDRAEREASKQRLKNLSGGR